MRLPEETIAAIVEEVAASHLGVGDRLARVRVRRGHGWQGDPLLWIDLLFTDERLALDTRRTLSLIGVVHDVSSSRARTPFRFSRTSRGRIRTS